MSLIIRLFIFIGILVTAPGLIADQDIDFEPIVVTPPSQPVTTSGENRHPLFISNDSIIFVSKDRQYHKDPQIYFKDLKSGRERRVTHQRGHIINGLWLNDKNKIVYASTTDEEKETPFIMKKFLERFPSSVSNNFFFHVNMSPSEIYSSDIDGTNIERLSQHSGFDAFPSLLEKKSQLLFSRWDKGHINLFAKSTKKNLKPWKVLKTNGHDLGLKLSPNKENFVWYRFSPDFQSAQLMHTNTEFKNPNYITLDSGINWSPSWHPDNDKILYSAKLDGSSHFDNYEVSVNEGCKRQITSFEGDEFYPAVSPDGKTLLFTSTQAGGEQLHKLDYPEPFSCDQ
ncbi:MAG: PD40 domain-containing protein [Bdellovibrionales bacterium]|nr:hypothetical protein [Bdellovibrionales bacterium]NQZ19596.1 PD40 domain-containing protein [Bdellovibrionales bacterium]